MSQALGVREGRVLARFSLCLSAVNTGDILGLEISLLGSPLGWEGEAALDAWSGGDLSECSWPEQVAVVSFRE